MDARPGFQDSVEAARHPARIDAPKEGWSLTVVESRVIQVCGRTFARAGLENAFEVRTAIVHELLHSLGLGENPPPPRYITSRVKQLCW